jgi:hypothetical protein
MGALVRMRLVGFTRTGRAFAPLVAVLIVLSTLYGGGQSQAGEAYGVSAAIMFIVLSWQTKVLLDVEPDVQRRLSRLAVGGPRRELMAGLIAAFLAGLPMIVLALVLPWLFNGIAVRPERATDPSLGLGILLGIWAHVLLLLPAIAVGALASRAVSGNVARGVAILLCGAIGGLVLGVNGSPAPWLAPPVIATARSTVSVPHPSMVVTVTVWSLLWSAVVLIGYDRLRRHRS